MKNISIKLAFWFVVLLLSNHTLLAQNAATYPDILMEHRIINLRHNSNVQPDGAIVFEIQLRAGRGYESAKLPMIATNIHIDFMLETGVKLNLTGTSRMVPVNPVFITNVIISRQIIPEGSIALDLHIQREALGAPNDFTSDTWLTVATVTVPLAINSAIPTPASFLKIRAFDKNAFWTSGWGCGIKPGIGFAYEPSCPENFHIGIDPYAIAKFDDIQKTYSLGVSTAHKPLPTTLDNINPYSLVPSISGKWMMNGIQVDTVSTAIAGATIYTFIPNDSAAYCDFQGDITIVVDEDLPMVHVQNFIYCDGEEAPEYTFTGSKNVTFKWHRISGHDLGLSEISGENKLPAFVAANYGFESIDAVYEVTPVTGSGLAGASQNFMITVNPRPVTSVAQDLVYCSGSLVPDHHFSSSIPHAFFEWEFVEGEGSVMIPGIPASGENFISTFVAHNYGEEPLTGKYRVRASYAHANLTCYDNEWQEFSITIFPKLSFIAMSDENLFLCENDNLHLFVEVKGSVHFQWYYEGVAIPGATEASYETLFDPSKAGIYSVAIAEECGSVAYYFFNVQANPLLIETKYHDALYIDNTGDKYVAYQWYKNGQPITQQGTAQYYTESGGFTPNAEYSLKAYKADGSYDETCPIIPNDGSKNPTQFKVYPNPATTGSTITILLRPDNDEQPEATAYIFDITGKMIQSYQITGYKTEIVVNLAAAPYMVRVITKNGREFAEKIIITK